MKTLREYIDQLDEISRRDFLKGAGATAGLAAIGAPKDAKAEWLPPVTKTDPMTDVKTTHWFNISDDSSVMLTLKNVAGYGYKTPMLNNVTGSWILPKESAALYSIPGKEEEFTSSAEKYPWGRLRIDNFPPVDIKFAFPHDSAKVAYILPGDSLNGRELTNMIGSAKERILIDVSQISNKSIIKFFNRQVREAEVLEDELARILEIATHK